MAAFFGVHVGNTSVCLAICKDEDRVEVVANDVGDRITPAISQWTPGSCIVGRTAQLEHFRNSLNTIIRNKQLINENIREEELDHLRNCIPYKIKKTDHNVTYTLLHDGKQFHVSPREVAGWIFKKTLSIAESAVGGSKEIKVVITVPLYYSTKSIELVREVAKKAGFNVLQVVDEPTTAALGCGLDLDPKEPPYYCLVYRVGGISIDATILLVQDGIFSVIGYVHKYDLGGALLTEKLSGFLTSEFKRQYGTTEITDKGKYKLYAAAETVKQVLSIQNVAQCSCESIGGGYDFNCSVSRARFENIIASSIPEIVAPIMEVIKKTNLSIEKIKKVVTCGGTMKTPKLQETLRKMLPSSEILINSNPDEIIAIGAAKQAGYCSGYDQLPNTLSIDTPSISTSLSIKVKQEGGEEMNYSVPENTSVPLRKRYDASCAGKSLFVSLEGNNNAEWGVATLNNVEPSSKVSIDLDVNKDGKILLTLTNEANNDKSYLKFDLNEMVEI